MSSTLTSRLAAAILLPIVAGCSQGSGRVSQAGRTVPIPTRGAAAVLSTADDYLGVPYLWGGSSPRTGFDCSGFVQFVFEQHGVELPRTSRQQAVVGSPVALDFRVLQPGDLIMFAERGRPISHVAIYAGDERIIHSSKSGRGVRYDDLLSARGEWFRQHAVVARRVGAVGAVGAGGGMAGGERVVRDFASGLRRGGVRLDVRDVADIIGDLAPRPD